MREILFKAKLKDWKTNPQQNKWVEGYYLSKKETTYCFAEDYEKFPVKTLHYIAVDSMTDWGLPNEFRCYEIDQDTLCQYTGLTDKNENKIWENDIVKVHVFYEIAEGYGNHETVQGIICYDAMGMLMIKVEIVDGIPCYSDILLHAAIAGVDIEIERLGNIFDNPEQIKSEF